MRGIAGNPAGQDRGTSIECERGRGRDAARMNGLRRRLRTVLFSVSALKFRGTLHADEVCHTPVFLGKQKNPASSVVSMHYLCLSRASTVSLTLSLAQRVLKPHYANALVAVRPYPSLARTFASIRFLPCFVSLLLLLDGRLGEVEWF